MMPNGASPTVLTLWVTSPWGLNDPFAGVTYDHLKTQIFPFGCLTAKLQLRSNDALIFCLGLTTEPEAPLKGFSTDWEGCR